MACGDAVEPRKTVPRAFLWTFGITAISGVLLIITAGCNAPGVAYYAIPETNALYYGYVKDDVATHQDTPHVLALLIAKRLGLYTTALAAVLLIADRLSKEPILPFGQRLQGLNKEYFGLVTKSPEEDEVYKSMDAVVTENRMAWALPLLLLTALIATTFFLVASVSSSLSLPSLPFNPLLLASLPAVAVTFAFGRAEIQYFLKSIITQAWLSSSSLSALLATGICFAAFSLPSNGDAWAVHNIANSLIAVSFARAVPFISFSALSLVAVGLAIYDSFTVLTKLPGGSVSIMETAASLGRNIPLEDAKLAPDALINSASLPAWRPGMLEIQLNHQLTDGLGLGDVIFPGLLIAWALRFDSSSSASSKPLFSSALFGYVIGLLMSELLPIASTGQPALLYVFPSIMLCLVACGLKEGKLKEMWSYPNNKEKSP
eukprot:gene4208-4625_t